MGISISVVALVSSLHLIAFVLAVGAERRRSTGHVVPDEYDERTYCAYDSDASTVYGLAAFAALLLSQAVVSWATRCLCCGRQKTGACSLCAFAVSWLSFLVAEACLLAGSTKNAYHTKYMGYFSKKDLSSCAALRKGVFAAAAAMVLVSMVTSLIVYWIHSKADTGGWVRQQNEVSVGMTDYGHDKGRGKLRVSPAEIVVLPQGFRFYVDLIDGPSRGYVAEVFGAHFQLPDLGPIGANGLAAARDFLVPTAWFDQNSHPGYIIVQKFGGELFTAKQDFSTFNVVAWHGNYAPYKSKFCPFNTVLTDHGDPSINTVLTAPSDKSGTALLDFVIFTPRWLVAEHTFRPPYYHRNCMSEFMGLIYGACEAKADGFLRGGASLHSCRPDTKTYEATLARGVDAEPFGINGTMAFMFESCLIPRLCSWALDSPNLDSDYYQCWIGLSSHFSCSDNDISDRK